jgi:hypothetical protein
MPQFNRPGPKMSLEALELKIVVLETQLLELKALLLNSPEFTAQKNQAKFFLSPRLLRVDLTWREWLGGSDVTPPAPGSGLVTQPTAPAQKRRVGRPTRLSMMLEEDRVRGEKIEARIAELQAEWPGLSYAAARETMADQVNLAGNTSRVQR